MQNMISRTARVLPRTIAAQSIRSISATNPKFQSKELVSDIFDKADVDNKGVITKDDLEIALGTYQVEARDVASDDAEEEASSSGGLTARISLTAEVIVSKIFPAGFGWQGASVVAGNMGFEATDLGFFLATGCGDATGVIVGHTLYYAIKKAVVDPTISMKDQFHTGLLLGCAAFHAGTAWQPIVNFLHDGAHLDFNGTLGGTFVGCGTMFYIGLRVGRGLLSPILSGVEPATYANLKNDAALSVSIGGATGCFVGTDVTFVTGEGAAAVDANWLRPVVGIEDSASDLSGMVSAGTSTALGFGGVQMVQNVVVPAGKSWVD